MLIAEGPSRDGKLEEPRAYRRGEVRERKDDRIRYDGVDPTGRDVVIEVRSDKPALLAEARLLTTLAHDALARVRDAGRADEDWFVVMDRWTGPSLEDLLPSQPVGAEDVAALLAPLAPALDLLHQAGLTHRGVCARNLVVSDPSAPRLWIIGNPSAGPGGGSPEEADTLVLKSPEGLDYVPPDLLDGAARPDVYALAVLAFRLLSGGFPFRRYPTLTQTLAERQESAPASIAETARRPVPRALEQWARSALAPEERRRPQTAVALLADLAHATGAPVGDHQRALERLLGHGKGVSEAKATILSAPAVRTDANDGVGVDGLDVEIRVSSIPPPASTERAHPTPIVDRIPEEPAMDVAGPSMASTSRSKGSLAWWALALLIVAVAAIALLGATMD